MSWRFDPPGLCVAGLRSPPRTPVVCKPFPWLCMRLALKPIEHGPHVALLPHVRARAPQAVVCSCLTDKSCSCMQRRKLIHSLASFARLSCSFWLRLMSFKVGGPVDSHLQACCHAFCSTTTTRVRPGMPHPAPLLLPQCGALLFTFL
jgi:hypothetical protein